MTPRHQETPRSQPASIVVRSDPRHARPPNPICYSVTLISYPISTSVLVPSQPRVPAALSMNRLVGSTYSPEMTPARGGPGMMRKGTVECLAVRVSRRSYSRRMS